jgi:hypothetical protein
MAHWWELWSPGLQAIGGVVELIGALILAREWWQATKNSVESMITVRGHIILQAKNNEEEWRIAKEEAWKMSRKRRNQARASVGVPERESYKEENLSDELIMSMLNAIKQRKTYLFGFFTVLIGSLLR